jgi:hypothetical protein
MVVVKGPVQRGLHAEASPGLLHFRQLLRDAGDLQIGMLLFRPGKVKEKT